MRCRHKLRQPYFDTAARAAINERSLEHHMLTSLVFHESESESVQNLVGQLLGCRRMRLAHNQDMRLLEQLCAMEVGLQRRKMPDGNVDLTFRETG